MDYEFRFFQGPDFQAVHITAVDNDAEACARARLYLHKTPAFSHVEVRRGFHFMRRIDSDSLPGETL
jgi:hypothetical protein